MKNLYDLVDKAVCVEAKTRLKDRGCLYENWTLLDLKITTAQQGNAPTDEHGGVRFSVADDDGMKLARHVCTLARMKHEVGDLFSVMVVGETDVLLTPFYQELAGMPGCYTQDFRLKSGGPFGVEDRRPRYVILTNCTWMLPLQSREFGPDLDCFGSSRGAALKTPDHRQLRRFEESLARCIARLFVRFVEKP